MVSGSSAVSNSFVSPYNDSFVSQSGWWCPALRLSPIHLSPHITIHSQQQYAFGFQSLVVSGSRGLVPGMRSELRGCAGFRDLSPGFRDLSPGFRGFWNLVSHHCVSFYGPSGFRGFIRVPGFLDFCFPSLCFFWFGTCFPGSGTFGTLSPIIVFVLWSIRARDFIRVPGFWTFVSHHCVFSCGLSGLRDFWNLVSHHCVCSVVHQGAGLHQGSGILGLLFPIIVFLLVPGLVSRVSGLVSRVPGLLEPCLPSLCFFLWFIRAPGFLEICLPSLCLFCGPSGRGTSSGFRDSWTFVSHHCVFSCGLSGLRDFWNLVSHHCVCSVVHQGAGLHQGSGILGLLFPIIVFLLVPGLVSRVPGLVSRVPGLVEPCLPSLCYFLWFMRAPGFLEIPNSRACWVSISRAGAGSRGLAAFKIRNGTLEPWNPGTLDLGTLEPWNPGTLGTLEPWNAGTLQPWNPGTLNLENVEPWNPATLEP